MKITVNLTKKDIPEAIAFLQLALPFVSGTETEAPAALGPMAMTDFPVPAEPVQTTGGFQPVSLPVTTLPKPETPTETPLADKNGEIWDATKHSTPAKLTKAGLWKKRKNYKPPTAPEAVPAPASRGYKELLVYIGKLVSSKAMDPSGIAALNQALGIEKLIDLKDLPAKVSEAFTTLEDNFPPQDGGFV